MNSIKERYFITGAILLGGMLSLLFAEVLARVVHTLAPSQITVEEDGQILRPDAILGHAIVPESEGHDSWGFKNEDAPQRVSLVALGDSHTYGTHGTFEDWPSFLAQRRGEHVYNMGVWGYGPVEYLALLPKALSLSPETIVVAFYLGNDVFNAYDAAHHRPWGEPLRSPSFTDEVPVTSATFKETNIPFQGLRDFLRKHLRSYRLLGDGTRIFRESVGLASPRTVGTRDWQTTDPDASLIFDTQPDVATKFWPSSRHKGVAWDDPRVKEGLAVTKRVLARMQSEVAREGVSLVIVLIPSKEVAYADLIQEAGFSNATYAAIIEDEAEIKNALLDFCRGEHLICADLTPDLQSAIRNGENVYRFHWDEHPTARGYAVYARSIEQALNRHNL
jgi:lysophospholipase L1-like esterase